MSVVQLKTEILQKYYQSQDVYNSWNYNNLEYHTQILCMELKIDPDYRVDFMSVCPYIHASANVSPFGRVSLVFVLKYS